MGGAPVITAGETCVYIPIPIPIYMWCVRCRRYARRRRRRGQKRPRETKNVVAAAAALGARNERGALSYTYNTQVYHIVYTHRAAVNSRLLYVDHIDS